MKAGLVWVLIEKFGAAFLSVAVFFVYAKLLSTEEMGIAIIILSITQFLALLLNTYFEDALVQKKDLTDNDISTNFWISVFLSLILMIVTCAGFYLWGGTISNHSLLAMASFASLEILFTNICTTYVAQLRRDGKFKILALRVILGRIAGALIGLICIFSNLGAWSILAQSVSSMVFQMATLLYTTRTIPKFNIQPSLLKGNVHYGVMMSLRRLSWDALVRLTPLIAGMVGGVSMAGIVGFAWRIVELPRSAISSGLSGYFLPILSRDRDNKQKIADDFIKITGLTTFFTAPLFLGIYLIAPALITSLFDAKWHDTIPLIQIFSLAGLIGTIRIPATVGMNAAGHPEKMLMADTMGSIIAILIMILFGHHGAWVMGMAYLIYHLVILPKSFTTISEVMNLSFSGQIKPVLDFALPAFIMFMALWIWQYMVSSENLFLIIFLGVFIFMVSAWVTHKQDIQKWIKTRTV